MMKVLCTGAATCESGATSIEYGLIAALVSVVLYSGAGTLGDDFTSQFKTLSTKLDVAANEQAQFGRGTGLVSLQSTSASGLYSEIRGPLP